MLRLSGDEQQAAANAAASQPSRGKKLPSPVLTMKDEEQQQELAAARGALVAVTLQLMVLLDSPHMRARMPKLMLLDLALARMEVGVWVICVGVERGKEVCVCMYVHVCMFVLAWLCVRMYVCSTCAEGRMLISVPTPVHNAPSTQKHTIQCRCPITSTRMCQVHPGLPLQPEALTHRPHCSPHALPSLLTPTRRACRPTPPSLCACALTSLTGTA